MLKNRIVILIFMLVVLLSVGSASATVYNDWFNDESLNTSIWTITTEPDTWDEGATKPGHLYINSATYAHFTQGGVDEYTNFTTEVEVDLSDMQDNDEVFNLRLYNGSSSSVYIQGLKYYSDIILSVRRYDGSSTILVDNINVVQSNTDDLVLRINKVEDQLNFYYIPDGGTQTVLLEDYTSPYASFNNVSIRADDGGTGDCVVYVDHFTFTDDDTGISIPDDPGSSTPGGSSLSVSYNEAWNRITISDGQANLSTVYDKLVATMGTSATQAIINETSTNTWKVIPQILTDNGTLVMNGDTLRTCYASGSYNSIEGNLTATDSTIIGWINSTDTNRTFTNTLPKYNLHNVNIDNLTFNWNGHVFIGREDVLLNSQIINDLTIRYHKDGLRIRATNASIDGIHISGASADYRTSTAGLDGSYITNSVVRNVTVYQPELWTGSFLEDATGWYGFQTSGHNNYFENIYVDGSTYSGYATGGTYNYYKNVTAKHTHHNAIEVHDKHSVFDGIYIDTNTIHGLFSSHAPDQSNPDGVNNSFYNGTIYHRGAGDKAIRGYMTNDFHYEDIYVYSEGGSGYQGDNCSGSTFINLTVEFQTNPGSGEAGMIFTYPVAEGSGYPSVKNSIINSNIDGNIVLRTSTDNKIVNTAYGSIIDDLSGWDSSYYLAYPLNIYVANTTNSPVENAQIDITTTGLSLDGYGSETTTFYTGANGKLNATQQAYVADLFKNTAASTAYYTVDVQASKGGQTDSELAINPDSGWYSSDLNNLQGTPITLTLDVVGSGESVLVITDITPADTTPSLTLGDSLNFTVTTSKTADIQWFSNGDLKVTTNDKNFSYYDKTPSSAGEYNVTAIATDGVDTVSQMWTLTVVEDPYFTGNTSVITAGNTYLNYPVRYTWSAGAFVISFPNDGTVLNENAPAIITGVEVSPL